MNMPQLEIERKFLLNSLPDMEPTIHIDIYQGYLSLGPEVRIRSNRYLNGPNADRKEFFLTIKGDGTLTRQEIETPISEEFFNLAAAFIGEPFIHKDFRVYIVNGYALECSVVDKGLDTSFIYGEVEFPSEKEAKAFRWPFAGATDVTEDKFFKMKNYWKRTRLNKEAKT